MELFYRKVGKGQSLIILHGLYGMSDNWISIARNISDEFSVWLPDLRNHGRSPHYHIHNYNEMAQDIYYFIKQHNIEKPIIAGHSMGGKVAMSFARKFPELISKLIVIDIAPVNYLTYNLDNLFIHKQILQSLINLNLEFINNRTDADLLLSKTIKEPSLRAFLLKNLQRNKDNKFYWLLNLPVIESHLDEIINGFDDWDNVKMNVPTLFIKGENSDYITEDMFYIISNIFVNSYISIIKSAGHTVHDDNAEDFIKEIKQFIYLE